VVSRTRWPAKAREAATGAVIGGVASPLTRNFVAMHAALMAQGMDFHKDGKPKGIKTI